jgi:hypothetical protein
MNEALLMVAGALLFGAGWLTGRVARLRSRPAPIRPICECGHVHGAHVDGSCRAEIRREYYNSVGSRNGFKWVPCACLRYTGPIPMNMDWVPPIATSE